MEDGTGIGVVIVWKGEIIWLHASIDAERRKCRMSSLQRVSSNDQPNAPDQAYNTTNYCSLQQAQVSQSLDPVLGVTRVDADEADTS